MGKQLYLPKGHFGECTMLKLLYFGSNCCISLIFHWETLLHAWMNSIYLDIHLPPQPSWWSFFTFTRSERCFTGPFSRGEGQYAMTYVQQHSRPDHSSLWPVTPGRRITQMHYCPGKSSKISQYHIFCYFPHFFTYVDIS